MTIFDSLRVNCRGRGDEIAYLKNTICGDPMQQKNAVLVFGDSGIGKTTLLRSLCEIIPSEYPEVFIGFYSVQGGETDPLLWSLDSLLKRVYTIENWAEQIPTAWTNLKRKASLAELGDLRRFLTKVLDKVQPEAGIGIFAKTMTSLVGTIGESISSLDAKIDQTLLRPQEIGEFCRITSLLCDALPERKFVLVIDNLNASGKTAIETIEAYLSQHSGRYPAVHLIISWKRDSDNIDTLHRLEKRLREYGGEITYLKPIASQEALRDWLESEFYWFAGLPDTQREAMVTLSGGLPEVVVRWKRRSSGYIDEATLAQIAEEVKHGKYSELVEMLGQADAFEQRLLYALALVNRPISIQALACCFSSTYDECRKILQKWSRDNFLLRHFKDDTGRIPLYTYDHDNKRVIALECLPDEIGDAKQVAGRLYGFLLKNFGSGQPGFAKLLSAAPVVSAASGVGSSAEEKAAINELVGMIDADIPPSKTPWRLPPRLSPNYGSLSRLLRAYRIWGSARHSRSCRPHFNRCTQH